MATPTTDATADATTATRMALIAFNFPSAVAPRTEDEALVFQRVVHEATHMSFDTVFIIGPPTTADADADTDEATSALDTSRALANVLASDPSLEFFVFMDATESVWPLATLCAFARAFFHAKPPSVLALHGLLVRPWPQDNMDPVRVADAPAAWALPTLCVRRRVVEAIVRLGERFGGAGGGGAGGGSSSSGATTAPPLIKPHWLNPRTVVAAVDQLRADGDLDGDLDSGVEHTGECVAAVRLLTRLVDLRHPYNILVDDDAKAAVKDPLSAAASSSAAAAAGGGGDRIVSLEADEVERALALRDRECKTNAQTRDRAVRHFLTRQWLGSLVSRGLVHWTRDWFTGRSWAVMAAAVPPAWWDPAIAPPVVRIAEIGSFEGLSARCMLDHWPTAQLTCIDTFQGGLEHADVFAEAHGDKDVILHRFAHNVLSAHDGRVRALRGRSDVILARLSVDEPQSFDLVFVDGSHEAADVLADAVLGFRILRVGGLLVFDDYTWKRSATSEPHENPQIAIDGFASCYKTSLSTVIKTNDTAIFQRVA